MYYCVRMFLCRYLSKVRRYPPWMRSATVRMFICGLGQPSVFYDHLF